MKDELFDSILFLGQSRADSRYADIVVELGLLSWNPFSDLASFQKAWWIRQYIW